MQVFVFIAPVCNIETAAHWHEQLSVVDRKRAYEMGSEKRRREFISARLLARQGLFEVYGNDAKAWTLAAQPNGALQLRGPDQASKPAISLSHSRGKVACAFAETECLGLDVEQLRDRPHLTELAEYIMHSEELAEFYGLDALDRARTFYAKWVMKEALGKALGYGLNYPMQDFLLNREHVLAAPEEWLSDPDAWSLAHEYLDGEFSLGLAWQGNTAARVSIQTVEIHL